MPIAAAAAAAAAAWVAGPSASAAAASAAAASAAAVGNDSAASPAASGPSLAWRSPCAGKERSSPADVSSWFEKRMEHAIPHTNPTPAPLPLPRHRPAAALPPSPSSPALSASRPRQSSSMVILFGGKARGGEGRCRHFRAAQIGARGDGVRPPHAWSTRRNPACGWGAENYTGCTRTKIPPLRKTVVARNTSAFGVQTAGYLR